MEIHFDSRHSLEENWLSGRYFHPPPVAINCPLWTGIDAPQQRYNMWKQGRVTQEITQRILWEIEEKEFHREDELPGEKQRQRRMKRARGLKLSRHPIENPYWLQQREKLNPLKDFLSSMQLTPNALTYQTGAHWALCPHITDFPLRANGKTRVFVFVLSEHANADACEQDTEGGFTEVAACLWSLTEHSEEAGKWCKYTRGTMKCSHSWSHTKALLNTHW